MSLWIVLGILALAGVLAIVKIVRIVFLHYLVSILESEDDIELTFSQENRIIVASHAERVADN